MIRNKVYWSGPILLVLILIIVLWFAPLERTLGSTIKYVYLHVALTWCGMVGIALMAAMGVGTLFRRSDILDFYRKIIGWVTIFAWGISILISAFAAKIAWGSISWSEPLMSVALMILISLLIVQIYEHIIRSHVVRGLLSIAPSGFLIVLAGKVTRVLHPLDPIHTSNSMSIKLTFNTVFIICLLLAAWVVWMAEQRRKSND